MHEEIIAVVTLRQHGAPDKVVAEIEVSGNDKVFVTHPAPNAKVALQRAAQVLGSR